MNAQLRADLRTLVDRRVRELVADDIADDGRVELPVGDVKPPSGPTPRARHGTEHAYVHYRCRCRDCREVARAARNKRRVSQAARERVS